MYKLIQQHKNYSLHIMVLILGFTGVFGKLISLNELDLVWYRMLIAFVILSFFLFFRKKNITITRRDFFGLLGVGAIVTLHWIFFFGSIKASSISVAVVCLSTSSLFSAFIEPIFFKRKIIPYEVVMGIVVILALIYILGADSQNILGYIYGISAAFLGTLFTLFNSKYLKKVDAATITTIEMFSGVLIITCILLYNQDYSVFQNLPTINDFVYLILLGTICTAIVFVWMTEIMRHVTPFSLIMAINLEPIYSIILALIIFGESEFMSQSFYIGASIIIGVVFLDGYLKNKQ